MSTLFVGLVIRGRLRRATATAVSAIAFILSAAPVTANGAATVQDLAAEAVRFESALATAGASSPAASQTVIAFKVMTDNLIAAGTLAPTCAALAAVEPTLRAGVYNLYPSAQLTQPTPAYCSNRSGASASSTYMTFWINPLRLPSGSYYNSCVSCSLKGSNLSCLCANTSGQLSQTSLNVAATQCGLGDVANINGSLTCSNSGNMPAGTYQKSCHSCVQSGKNLFCECNDGTGASLPSTLEVTAANCGAANIFNLAGVLTCDKSYTLPVGTYANTCNSCAQSGTTLSCKCPTPYFGKFLDSSLDASAANCGSGNIFNDSGALTCVKSFKLPVGSYANTCDSCTQTGTTLSCKCANPAGKMANTSLDVSAANCGTSDISAPNGALSCANTGNLPSGSYAKTCDSCTQDWKTVSCKCENAAGQLVHSALDVSAANCGTGDISNFNGTLSCSSSGLLPTGTYAQSCDSCSISGNILSCKCMGILGVPLDTALNASAANCGTADIISSLGVLQCSKFGDLPPGSYQTSCNSCVQSGTTVSCNCVNGAGQYAGASLDTAPINCGPGDISNKNGVLTCPPSVVPAALAIINGYLIN